MISYFDASCLVTLVLRDAGWRELGSWMSDRSPELVVSDFGFGETVSVIALRVRRGSIDAAVGRNSILYATAFTAGWTSVDLETSDIVAATALVARFDLKLRLPDAIHIAIAQRVGARLVSADTRQADAAEALGMTVFNPLAGAAS